MCTRNQAKNKQTLNDEFYKGGSDKPSAFRRTVAWITLVSFVGQPMLASAQVTADQAAAANKHPTIDVTANGLPLVQIAAPSAAGVSHNQYNQFNVDPVGLILNNSQTTIQTQQAGYISGNPNLAGGAAHVILNEVTSTNRSQLNGYIEVAGQQAEVIVANPNGITCNGCGFINANRGVLTTGTPVMGAGGSLDSFRVTGGDIQIGTAGLNGTNLSQLDLIARSVQVNGELWGTNLNVITGANLVDYNTLGVQIIQGDANKPTVGIDVALLGGMYANKIRLIGTEAGVGVNSLGTLSAQAGDFYLDYQGQITLNGNTNSTGNLSINSNTSITNNGTLYSQQAALLTSTGSITNSALLTAQGNLTLNAGSLYSTGALGAGIDGSGNASQTGNLLITTQGQTVASGQNVAGGNIDVTASNINLANSNTNANSGITLNATAGNIDLTNAWTQTFGDIVLHATGAVTNNQGLLIGTQITSNSASFSNTAGEIYANENLKIITTGDITNSGALSAKGELTLNAANLNSTGTLGAGIDGSGNATQSGNLLITTQGQTIATGQNVAGGSLNITATDINLANSNTNARNGLTLKATAGNLNLTGAWAQTTGDIVLAATGAVTNDHALLIGTNVTNDSASFSNMAGDVYASGNLRITTIADITNSGSLSAMGNLKLDAANLNSTGTLGAGIDGSGVATKNGNITIVTQNQTLISGQIVAGAISGALVTDGGNLSITATDINLANSNTNAVNGIILTATSGNIDLTRAWTQTTGDIVLNATGAITNDHALLIGSNVTSNSASFSNIAGDVYANGILKIATTADITNSGSLSAMGNLKLDAANLNSTGTLGAGIDGSGKATKNGNITIVTQNQTLISGQIVAGAIAGALATDGGNLSITATDINLANSNTNAKNGITLNASAGNINLTSAWTQTTGDIVLTATGAITNDHALLIGSNITSTSASFSNMAGDVYANGILEIATTADITNSGSLSAMGKLKLDAANLNSTGSLGAGIDNNGNATQNGNITIITQNQTLISGQVVAGRLTGALPADGGNLSITATNINLSNSDTNTVSGTTLTATAGNIDLTHAKTQSAGDIILSATGAVINDQGTLNGAAITSTSAGFSNTAGNAYATGDLFITSTGSSSITNSGELSAQGNLTLVAGSVNSTGTLGAGIDSSGNATRSTSLGDITITTLQGQTVATGQNIAGRDIKITATDINLSNSHTNVWGGINLTATTGNINLTSAKTQAVLGAVVLNATAGLVNNTDGDIFGNTVIIDSASFNNTNSSGTYDGLKGVVGAYGDLTLTTNSLDNTNGKIGNELAGGGKVTLDLNTTGNLTNVGGKISSDTDLLINANTFTGNGTVIAGNNAKINLQGNYTNAAGGNVYKVNHDLTFTTTGDFINQTALEAGGAVTVNAVNIDNQYGAFVLDVLTGATNPTGAYINGNMINLIATGNLTNQGILNAGSKVTASGIVVSNTGSLFGGSVSIAATQLIENVGPTAAIGARDSNGLLELLAPTIQNRDDTTSTDTIPETTIIGLGQVVMAGGIDAQNQYTNATQVLNQSGLIQSGGNMDIYANTLTNTRRVLTMSNVFTQIGAAVTGQAVWTPGSTVPGNAPPTLPVGTYLYTTYTTTVLQNSVSSISPAAQIMSGADLNTHINTVHDYWSQITANGNMPFDVVLLDQGSWRNGAISYLNRTSNSGTWVFAFPVGPGTPSNPSWGPLNNDVAVISPNSLPNNPIGYYDSTYTAHGNMVLSGAQINNVAATSANTPLGAQGQSPSSITPAGGPGTPPGSLAVPQGGQAAQPGNLTVPQSGQASQTSNLTVPQGGQASQPGSLSLTATQPPALNNLTLPQGGLYSINNAPQSHYLVETNPAFTNHSQWMSSDWYFSHAGIDPSAIQKRLGDGFYEQQLVRQELMSLTGRTLLSASIDEQTQFISMMTSGAQVAVALKLEPGIGLSADQASKLTDNVIIMETRVVQGQTVLVPVVYLAQISAGDLLSSGPLIAANNITMNDVTSFTNSGTIKANNTLTISGQSINNRGGNLQSGGVMHLTTVGDIDFTSANVQAGSLALNAGGNLLLNTDAQNKIINVAGVNSPINISSTQLGRIANMNIIGDASILTGGNFELNGAQFKVGGDLTTDTKGNWQIGTQQIHETASINAPGALFSKENIQNIGSTVQVGGQSNIKVGGNLVAQGAQINLKGGGTIHAGGNVEFSAVKDSFGMEGINSSSHIKTYDETLISTNLQSGKELSVTSGKDINLTSSTINVAQGNATLAATGNVNILADTEKHTSFSEVHSETGGFLSSSSTTNRSSSNTILAVGSELSADSIIIKAGNNSGKGNITVTGSSIAATNDVLLDAAHDINILAATSTSTSSSYSHTEESGFMSNGGLSFTIGNRETTDKADSRNTLQSQNRSQVGSLNGNLTLNAGNKAQISGSDLAAAQDIAVTAQDITINSGLDDSTSHQEHDAKQSGLTVALSSNVTTAAQTVDSMKSIGSKSQDSRTKALAAITSATAISNAANQNVDISVSATVGSSHSHSDSTQTSQTHSGSTLNAGGNVSLTATGGGKDSNITIQGSDIGAGKNINLTADNKINLLADNNTADQVSHSSSSSAGVGVVVSTSAGLGITANAAKGRGNADGTDTTRTNTHVNAGQTLNLKSGSDTNLIGATAKGNTINADISGKLNIESLQDTSTYASKQENLSAGATISLTGGASSASVGVNQSKINGNYASVNEQSGLMAGDGGFNITALGGTTLKGGVISSTEAAVNNGKNTLTTATLSISDLNNHADYNAQSVGISGGVGNGGGNAGNNKGGPSMNTPVALNAKGNNTSTTQSGISGAAITITNNEQQKLLTGQDADTTIASLNRDVTTGKDTSGHINNNLDVNQIQNNFTVTQAFVQQASTFIAIQAQKADQAKADLQKEQAKPESQQDLNKINQLNGQIADSAKWGPGGDYRQIATALTAAAGGNVTGGTSQMLQGAAVNYLQSLGAEQIKVLASQLGGEGSPAHTALHGILACGGASAQGADCGTAAMGASAGVVINTLLGGDPNTMTAQEKEDRKNLVTSLVAGIATASGSNNVSTATNAAQVETENNAMLAVSHVKDPKLAKVCAGESQGVCGLANRVNQSGVTTSIQGMPQKDKWQIVAYADANGNPVAYAAYNTVTGNTDLMMDPQDLKIFMSADSKGLQAVVDIYNQAPSYGVVAGDGQTAKGWELALKDPHWWVTAVTSVVGAAAMLPAGGASVTASLESGAEVSAAAGGLKPVGGNSTGVAANDSQILAGSNLSHINGSIGELRGYQSAIDDLGQMGIQSPGKVSATGPDYITYDPASGNVIVWDSKYRGPGGSYPSNLPADKVNSWMPQVSDAIHNLPPGPLRDAAIDALQSGKVQGQIFRWPN